MERPTLPLPAAARAERVRRRDRERCPTWRARSAARQRGWIERARVRSGAAVTLDRQPPLAARSASPAAVHGTRRAPRCYRRRRSGAELDTTSGRGPGGGAGPDRGPRAGPAPDDRAGPGGGAPRSRSGGGGGARIGRICATATSAATAGLRARTAAAAGRAARLAHPTGPATAGSLPASVPNLQHRARPPRDRARSRLHPRRAPGRGYAGAPTASSLTALTRCTTRPRVSRRSAVVRPSGWIRRVVTPASR